MISMILTTAYTLYMIYVIFTLISSSWKTFGLIFIPHILVILISTGLTMYGCSHDDKRWTFLIAGLLLMSSVFIFNGIYSSMYYLVAFPAIFCFIAFMTRQPIETERPPETQMTQDKELLPAAFEFEVPPGIWIIGHNIEPAIYSIHSDNCRVSVANMGNGKALGSQFENPIFFQLCSSDKPINKISLENDQIIQLTGTAIFGPPVSQDSDQKYKTDT